MGPSQVLVVFQLRPSRCQTSRGGVLIDPTMSRGWAPVGSQSGPSGVAIGSRRGHRGYQQGLRNFPIESWQCPN
jgi:hypothetical protein